MFHQIICQVLGTRDHGTSFLLPPRTEYCDLFIASLSKYCLFRNLERVMTLNLLLSDQVKSREWWEKCDLLVR